jgi:microcystin-dependent protein
LPPIKPNPGTICTGDTLTTPLVRYEFFAPPDQWIFDALIGFFDDYTWPAKFTPCGEINVDLAAATFSAILESLGRSTLNIGSIIAYAGNLPTDPAILACDGTSYLRADYPELFAVIGTTWGADDSTHFNVPDLRTRALVMQGVTPDSSVWNLGDLIGEEFHTLNTSEIPSHTHTDAGHVHTEIAATAAIINGGLEAPAAAAIPTPSVTGTGFASLSNTGGGGHHNNTQRSAVILYAIVAF